MTRLSRALSCGALLAAAPALAAPPKPAASPAPLTLRFAWPASLQAQVTEKLTLRVNDADPGQGFTLRYPLKTSVRKTERWLEAGTPEVTPAAYARVFQGMPTVIINPAGAFLRAEVPETVVESAVQVRLRVAAPNLPADKQAQLREQARQELAEGARKKWDKLVGQWRGRKLRPGVEEKARATLPSTVVGGPAVEAEERLSVEGPVPCEPGAADKRCVRLRRETVADAKALAALAQQHEKRLNEGLAPNAPRTRVARVELRTLLELVTEPDTLVPHRLREEQVDWVVSAKGAQPESGQGRRGEQEIVFTPAAK